MKVGIDTLGCDHGKSGIGSYLCSLVKNLPVSDDIAFELFGSELDRYTFSTDIDKCTYSGFNIHDSITSYRVWHFLNARTFADKKKYDVVLYPSGSRVLPFLFQVPGVLVINDVISDILKERHSMWRRIFFLRTLRNSSKIIAASQYIRKDLVTLGIEPSKIEVIHNGIDHSLFYPHTEFEGDTVLIKPFSIKRPYLIYATRIKNQDKKHIELIKAFDVFKKNTGLPHRLVLAGDGEFIDEVQKVASKSEYASDIFFTGYFPHENLPELYSCADACVFPSISEGVGLPVIEAMATGIPVCCAKSGSLPEIAGDCALYFNSDDIEDIASVLEIIIKDQKTREKLIKSGFEWTKRFSWEKTAQKTIDILKQAFKLN